MPGGFGDLEIIDVLPADEYPGDRVVENMPRRFMFLYITDRDYDDPGVLNYLQRWESAPTGPRREVRILSGRRFRALREQIPGNPRRFLTYHPWGLDGLTVPNNVKYTAAQFVQFMRDKALD